MAADLERIGTPVGSERDEVVNIVACPGNERCRFGNVDSISLAKKIDARLFGREMPVKMRISIAACPNACTSPMLNEIGVIASVAPLRIAGLCTGCGTCVGLLQGRRDQDKRGDICPRRGKMRRMRNLCEVLPVPAPEVERSSLPDSGRRAEGGVIRTSGGILSS